jgi:uncharacterized protein YdbL (DUF1318 family)
MRYLQPSLSLPLSLIFTACVTINIYFPAAAAERAADRIIREVWDVPPAPGAPSSSAPAEGQTSGQSELLQSDRALTSRLLDMLLTPAYAQEPNLTISTPAIDKLTNSMRARHPRLEPYYQSGAVGLTNRGLIEIRDPSAVPLNERNAVRQLVADENNDRNALYREIANANSRPEWEENIRQTFAGRWVANARSGWWYQDGGGAWRQK